MSPLTLNIRKMFKTIDMYNEITTVHDNKNVCKYKTGKKIKYYGWIINKWMTEWMKVKGGNLNWIDGFFVEIILMMRGDFSLNGFLMILFYNIF